MVASIGVVISLYIIARYAEMCKGKGLLGKIVLAVFSLVTFVCLLSFTGFFGSTTTH